MPSPPTSYPDTAQTKAGTIQQVGIYEIVARWYFSFCFQTKKDDYALPVVLPARHSEAIYAVFSLSIAEQSSR